MNKNILKAIGAVVLVLAIAFFVGAKNSNLGGSFNPVVVDFAQGISVNGTQVIDNTGAYVGTLSIADPLAITGTLTVGVDDTGADVTFYGATSGKSFLWDESADKLVITGTASISGGLTYQLPVVAPGGDATLTVAQSGSFVKMNTAGEDITLPAVASSAGVHYKFAVTGAVATTNMTIASAEGDNIEGSLIVAGAVVDCDANDVITFVIDGENIGDFVDLYSDGTSWLIGASGGLTASKMTCSG